MCGICATSRQNDKLEKITLNFRCKLRPFNLNLPGNVPQAFFLILACSDPHHSTNCGGIGFRVYQETFQSSHEMSWLQGWRASQDSDHYHCDNPSQGGLENLEFGEQRRKVVRECVIKQT